MKTYLIRVFQKVSVNISLYEYPSMYKVMCDVYNFCKLFDLNDIELLCVDLKCLLLYVFSYVENL